MNKRTITIFVIFLAAVVVAIVARDLVKRSPARSAGNPYELEIDSFLTVDPSLITYKEYRQIRLDMEKPAGITLAGNDIYLVGDNKLVSISQSGELLSELELEGSPTCITAIPGENTVAGESAIPGDLLCIGFKDHFGIYRSDGTPVAGSEIHSGSSVFTALAVRGDRVYIADAGIRRVLAYDLEGNYRGEIRGESGEGSSHGFIIPSPNFHLAFDPEGELWVANPGIHTLQNYDEEGTLLASWSNSSPKIEGFNGCCNPAKFTFLPDGRFLTSEKGLVRIKIYSPEGKFESVVAAPEKFVTDGEAPDLAIDDQGNIIALDVDKKMIRFFNPS
jgi:hypothetical protein